MNKIKDSAITKDEIKKQNIIIHKDIAIQKLSTLLSDYIQDPLTLEKLINYHIGLRTIVDYLISKKILNLNA